MPVIPGTMIYPMIVTPMKTGHSIILVALASGNLEMAEMIAHLHDRLARFMVLRHAGKSQELTHAQIVDALQAHDVEAAKAALLDDIDSSRDAILDGVLDEVAASWHLD